MGADVANLCEFRLETRNVERIKIWKPGEARLPSGIRALCRPEMTEVLRFHGESLNLLVNTVFDDLSVTKRNAVIKSIS
jgi:hypothetical protein